MMMDLDTMPCFLVGFEPRGLGTLSLGAEHPHEVSMSDGNRSRQA